MLSTTLRRLAALGGAAVVTSAVVAAIAIAGPSGTQSAAVSAAQTGKVVGYLTIGSSEPMPVLAYSVGLTNEVADGGGGAGRVTHKPFTVTKLVDQASPGLFEAAESGRHFATATFTADLGSGGRAAQAVYDLENVIIVELDHSSADGSVPTETLSLNFEDIEINKF
jgi:type VI secretion system secreted protein Hcp